MSVQRRQTAKRATMSGSGIRTILLCAILMGQAARAADRSATSPVPLSPPSTSSIPAGPLGDAIRYGQRIVTDTQATVKPFVGNALNCSNCHLGAGRTAQAAPFVGLTGLFPEYRARRGAVESLEDRINDCFLRSMNGRPLPSGSVEMTAVLAYIAWLSSGVPVGTEVQGRGFRNIEAPAPADPVRGKALYAARCASCHGGSGEGIKSGPNTYAFPPLWGAQSFNVGAGMARVSIAAAFVQAKMPLGNAGTLTDQEAVDIAAYFSAQPRPDFAAKKKDWPKGGRPADSH
jgi:thiosulfate dehydrogenase